ncbi:MAG: peroxiredoxin family protein [Chloroflexota bacterium]
MTTTATARGRTGAPLPDITLPTLDGKEFRLGDVTGKRTLLFFWGSW